MSIFTALYVGLISTALANPVAHGKLLVHWRVKITNSSQPSVADSNVVKRGTPTVQDATSVQETISLCTQYAYYAANGYEVLNNLWGKDTATSGSQCTYYEGASGSGINWSSTWTWQGAENNVKSYVYAGRQVTKGNTIAKISTMPTQIDWRYNTTSNVRANVAYDVFTAADPNHVNSSGDYELMIWCVYAHKGVSLPGLT
jgi:xyloglucan-specific endo-beta-1,4-glucanase